MADQQYFQFYDKVKYFVDRLKRMQVTFSTKYELCRKTMGITSDQRLKKIIYKHV